MTHTRRGLLGAAAALVSMAGCTGGEDATGTPTDTPTGTATSTETPTETETETRTQTPGEPSVRLWPWSVTTVLDGDVGADAIFDAFPETPSPAQVYSDDRGGDTVTYFVSAEPSLYVADAEEAFADAGDLSVRRVYRGVGPQYRRSYASALSEQAAERAGVDPDSVTLSVGRRGDHQFLDVAAPTSRSALVPMLPELSFQRVDGDQLVGPDGFAVDAGFFINQRRADAITVNLTLDDSGLDAFTAAVEAASDEALRDEFFRPVVDGEPFEAFGLSERFVTDVENGDWRGKLAIPLDARTGDGHAITRLTGLPSVPLDCEILD